MSFPSSPNDNDTTVVNGINYVYVADKNAWKRVQVDFTGAFGGGGGSGGPDTYGRDTANAAYTKANSAFDKANGAYDQSNTAIGLTTTASTYANMAFDQANTAISYVSNVYNVANNKLDITGGEITGSLIVDNQMNVNHTLVVGQGAPFQFPGLVAQFTSGSPDYIQVNVQNVIDTGSSDIVATADNGTDSANYTDLGIQGSADMSGDLLYPNDSYLIGHGTDGYVQGSNLVISQTTASYGDIIFAQGGLESQNESARFKYNQGLIVKKNITSNTSTINQYVDLVGQASNPSSNEGRIWYNIDEHAIKYFTENGLPLDLGKQVTIRVYNDSGVTIPKGAPVRVTGGETIDVPHIALAQADTYFHVDALLGAAGQDITDGSYGYVVTAGPVVGVDTSLVSAGRIVYVSNTTAGGYTQDDIPPSEGFAAHLGMCLISDAINGVIHVALKGIEWGANFTTGAVAFSNGYRLYEDPTQFYYDYTNHRLGIGTDAPSHTLTVLGDSYFGGNVTITGKLTSGNFESVSTSTLTVSGSTIVLNDGTTGDPVSNATILVNRGTSPNTYITWNEDIDEWVVYENNNPEGHLIHSEKTAKTWDDYNGWATYEKLTHPIGADLAHDTYTLSVAANTKADAAISSAQDAYNYAQAAFNQANTGGVSSITVASTDRLTQDSTTGAINIDLAVSGATPGTYSYPSLHVDSYGRVTDISALTPVTSFNTQTGDVTLDSTGIATILGYTPGDNVTDVTGVSVTGGSYGDSANIPVFTLEANGRISSITTASATGGPAGPTGPTGPKGDTGATGPAGPAAAIALRNTSVSSYTQNEHFLANAVEGSSQIYPHGSGANLSDTPNSWRWDKLLNYSSSPGIWPSNFGQPTADVHDWSIAMKRYYYRADLGWSMRERMWYGETVGQGPDNLYGKTEVVLDGNNAGASGMDYDVTSATWFGYCVPYTGDTTQASAVPTGISTSGKYLEQATVQSFAVAAGDIVYFHINGVSARVSWQMSTGDEGVVDASGYTPTTTTYTVGGSGTFYYHYWAIGDDSRRTFIKVLKQTAATTYWHTKFGPDRGGNTWYWYGQQTKATGDGILTRPDGFDMRTRYDRYYTNSLTAPAVATQPYTIGFRFKMSDITTTGQNILTVGSSGGTGVVVSLANAYRVQAVLYSGGVAQATWQCYQFTDVNQWCTLTMAYNPLDTAATFRMYAEGVLIGTTTGNYGGAAATAGYNIGSTTIATANGFIGNWDFFYMVPEDHCARYGQGSFTHYVDPWDAGWTTALSNGDQSRGASITTAYPPPAAYVIGTYPNGTLAVFDGCWDYSEAGFSLSCSCTSGDAYFNFLQTTGGFTRNPGIFLVTGTGIPTTQNYYVSINYGDKGFFLYDVGGTATGANATSASTAITFTRVNGGPYNGSAYIRQPGNAAYFAKQSALALTLTNNITTAFPSITFTTVITGFTGSATFRTDYPDSYITAGGTTNDGPVRVMMNALASGKYYTITGSGITAASATIPPAYVVNAEWDWAGRGFHKITLNRSRDALYAAGTMTLNMYMGAVHPTITDGLDRTGGTWPQDPYNSSIWSRYYSSSYDATGSSKSTVDAEIQYGYGQVNSWRLAPPKGIYDSGIFIATAASYAKKMYLGYGAVGWLLSYGTVGSLGRTTSQPTITALTTQISSDGINVSTTSGTIYRIVVIPINNASSLA